MRIWKLALGVVVAGAAVVAVARIYNTMLAGGTAAQAKPPAFVMPVPVAAVVKKPVPIYLSYSARTESIRNVTLLARVAGYVQKQQVEDGADVKEGQLLYTIDPRDYQASLDQAKAQAERDAAAGDYARQNLDRGSKLAMTGFLAKDSFDQRTSTLRQAEAALAADKAAIRTAELNLGYTFIRAPFPGRVGKNLAPVGTLIAVGGTPLNTLVQLDPIYVTFNPSETDLAALQKARAAGKVKAEILLDGDKPSPHGGTVTFIDNTVDRATGTITARATIANSGFSLLPGQYVRIRLLLREQSDALMVPLTAIGSSQLGKYVYLLGKGNKVEQRLVTLGPSEGELVAVSGLHGGEQVIVGNLQKIGPGAPVQPLPPQQANAQK